MSHQLRSLYRPWRLRSELPLVCFAARARRICCVAAGVLIGIGQGVVGRPAVAAKLLEQGGLPVLVNLLLQVPPAQLVATAGHSRHPHGYAIWAVKELAEATQASGGDLSTELLSCGYIDLLVRALCAVQEVGADGVHGQVVVQGMLHCFVTLDGAALPEIEAKLRAPGPAQALRYVKDSKIVHIPEFGYSSGTMGAFLVSIALPCLAYLLA